MGWERAFKLSSAGCIVYGCISKHAVPPTCIFWAFDPKMFPDVWVIVEMPSSKTLLIYLVSCDWMCSTRPSGPHTFLCQLHSKGIRHCPVLLASNKVKHERDLVHGGENLHPMHTLSYSILCLTTSKSSMDSVQSHIMAQGQDLSGTAWVSVCNVFNYGTDFIHDTHTSSRVLLSCWKQLQNI